jgi:RimJ/RimL family protein N-acetyltransferase
MLRTLPISIGSFEATVGRALRRAPVQNQLQLDVMQRVIGDPQRQPTAVHLVAVEDVSSGDVGVAMQTPPRKVIVSMTTGAIARELGRVFTVLHSEACMVHGPEDAAWAFAAGAGARNPRLVMREGLYALERPVAQAEAPGAPRLATVEDALTLQRWIDGFSSEALQTSPNDPTGGERLGRSERAWIWLAPDGTPVSMAYNSRRVEGWWSIGPVYTPPEHRGHGYATALVTHLSEWALASGATGCTLFTDLANPVSNRIYERIGYRRVGACATVAW